MVSLRVPWAHPKQPGLMPGVKYLAGQVGCDDCRADKDEYHYMVTREVWALATRTTPARFLCLDCLEARIGRSLTAADFPPHLPSNHIYTIPQYVWPSSRSPKLSALLRQVSPPADPSTTLTGLYTMTPHFYCYYTVTPGSQADKVIQDFLAASQAQTDAVVKLMKTWGFTPGPLLSKDEVEKRFQDRLRRKKGEAAEPNDANGWGWKQGITGVIGFEMIDESAAHQHRRWLEAKNLSLVWRYDDKSQCVVPRMNTPEGKASGFEKALHDLPQRHCSQTLYSKLCPRKPKPEDENSDEYKAWQWSGHEMYQVGTNKLVGFTKYPARQAVLQGFGKDSSKPLPLYVVHMPAAHIVNKHLGLAMGLVEILPSKLAALAASVPEEK